MEEGEREVYSRGGARRGGVRGTVEEEGKERVKGGGKA